VAIFHSSIAQAVLSFVVWFLVFYLYHGLGTTLGYHRLLTHKSLKVPLWLKYFIVSGGYLGLMGAPIPWVGMHRLHHQKSDLEGDPHTPTNGFKHALYEWMFQAEDYQTNEELHGQTQDLMSDKVFALLGTSHDATQAQLCLASCIVFRLIILFTLGWIPLLANLFATFGSFWSTQFVNTFCHMQSQGYRSYETKDLSRNVWWVGILALGEGWHNNHHAIPKSARHGFKWYEVDLTWYTIWLLERLGLADMIIKPIKTPALSPVRAKTSMTSNAVSTNNEIAIEQSQLEPVTVRTSIPTGVN